ncbi:MAG: DUF4838 domain-containing protein [Armatimonadetes bacterium]|nr:DUF4838 domain-containing protein [Armatimonadota bacterium]
MRPVPGETRHGQPPGGIDQEGSAMHTRTILAVLMAIAIGGTAMPGWALLLASGGHTQYDVVLSKDQASPSEHYAARELTAFLKQITGADFPVRTDDQVRGAKHIFLGDSKALRRVAPGLNLAPLGREGYVIKTVGDSLILAGGRQRGTLYAVYGFLEDHLGCRWFTPDCSRIPRLPRLEVGPINERKKPALEYREDFIAEAFDGTWAARNRMNGQAHRLSREQGDKVHYVGFVHTFYSLVPPSKYFKTHPEYFALVKGKRRSTRAQLCLTNPDVLRIATEAVRQRLRDAKAKGLPPDVIVSVSQNDCWGWCECPKCKALAEREGSQSGPILHFVNQIADAIRDEFPHAAIDTLAYSYSRKPPKYVKPRPNVIVRLCSIECCFSHPLATCPANASFMDDLERWSKICRRLYVWDYVTNFAHYQMPFPNLRVLAPNIRTFVAHNVRGIFEEGNYHGGGEFCHLRAYMLAKLLWDPDYDPQVALQEFTDAYYGPAAPYIRRYINLIHDTVERENIHVRIYSPPTSPFLRPEILRQANELFDQAEHAVQSDAKLLLRVRHARMPLMYVAIVTFNPSYREVGSELVPANVGSYERTVADFAELAHKLGISRIREGQAMDSWLKSRPSAFPSLKVVRLKSKDLIAEIVPQLGGRLFKLMDRCLWHNFLYSAPPATAAFPREGGYVDFPGESWPGPGVDKPWRLVEQRRYKVVLSRDEEGLRLTRTIELDPARPVVTITAQVTNVSRESREVRLRLHPCFDVGKVDDCVVTYSSPAGPGRVRLATFPEQEKDIFLEGDEMPRGQWTVENYAYHWAIQATFDPGQVSRCLLNFNRPKNRVNLELYSPVRQLKPNQSMRVQYKWLIQRNSAFYRSGLGARDYGRWGF